VNTIARKINKIEFDFGQASIHIDEVVSSLNNPSIPLGCGALEMVIIIPLNSIVGDGPKFKQRESSRFYLTLEGNPYGKRSIA
jgi:hypothetical protein